MASDPENEERRVVIKANQYFQIERDFDASRYNFFAWGPHQINYLHDMPFPPDKPIYLIVTRLQTERSVARVGLVCRVLTILGFCLSSDV